MKLGLALGGGSARGLALFGVIDVLQEEGVRIDCVAGTSIGALIGAGLASGRYEVLREHALSMDLWKLLRFIEPSYPVEGLLGTKKVVEYTTKGFGIDRIEDMEVPFATVCCDLRTGNEELITKGPLKKVLRASLSIPGLFSPVEHGGKLLVDGGIVNPVPVSAVRRLGADRVIAVDLNHYVLEKGTENPKRSLVARALQNGVLGKDPNVPHVFDMIMDALYLMERSISSLRLKEDRPDVLIRPRVGDISLFDYYRPKEAIEKGRKAAVEQLDDIRKLTGSR